MKNRFLLLVFAALTPVVFSGCVGTGPNTQQGAVTGGALGAIAGAIIGHNSRGGDALGGAILGGAAGAIAGGTIGNSVDHQQGTLYDPPARGHRPRGGRGSPPPPPAPLVEAVPPAPAAHAVWIPGAWIYDGRAYAWSAGHWEIPPPNTSTYVAAHREWQGDRYVIVPGYWR